MVSQSPKRVSHFLNESSAQINPESLPGFDDPNKLFSVENIELHPPIIPEGLDDPGVVDPKDGVTYSVQDQGDNVLGDNVLGAPDTLSDNGGGLDYSEEQLMSLTEAVFSIPSLVWSRLQVRTNSQLQPFNKALYIYCNRRGVDPFDWFFDELPLVLAGIGVFGGMYRDYREAYPKKPLHEEIGELGESEEQGIQSVAGETP